MCDYFKRLVVYCDGRRRIRSTPRKEDADGAHNEDPPPDDAADGSTTGTHRRTTLQMEAQRGPTTGWSRDV